MAEHDVADLVVALGDGQRDDPRGLGGELLDHGLLVVGREPVVDDRADHARLVGPVGVLDHERVQVVLRRQRVAHRPVLWHHPDAADAVLEALALAQQAVVVHR